MKKYIAKKLALGLSFALMCSNLTWAETVTESNQGKSLYYSITGTSSNKASNSNAEKDDWLLATDSNANDGLKFNHLLAVENPELVIDIEQLSNYDSHVKIKWTIAKFSHFNIYRAEDGGEFSLLEKVFGETSYTYIDTTVKKGITYTYKITTVPHYYDEVTYESEGKTIEITVSNTEMVMPDNAVMVGATEKVDISFLNFDVEPKGTWKSSDTDIATVDNDGVISAKTRGNVNIFFTTEDGYEKSCNYVCYDEIVPPASDMYTSREWDVFKITNRNRMKEGHLPLSMNPLMQTGTDIRKNELKTLYSHARPDGRNCFSVFNDIGFDSSTYGENIAAGYGSPARVMDGWMNSKGHYENIMNNSYIHFATGEKSNSWVQMFSGCGDDDLNYMELFLTDSLTFNKNTSIDDFGLIVAFNCSAHGISYMPLLSAMCTGYDSTQEGEQKITVTYKSLESEFDVTIKGGGSSSGGGGGGGSSSGGGGGGGSSSGGGGGGSSSGGAGKGPNNGSTRVSASVPSYVVKGTWNHITDGNWRFSDANGLAYKDKWAAVENPYANASLGHSVFDWFYFDSNSNMVTEWYKDSDENQFYMNPNQDGTRGKMITGWFWIPDQNGIQKCYYFNPNSDGTRGKMFINKTIDGELLNENGEWVVNGIVQTK